LASGFLILIMTTNPEIAKRAYELWEQAGRPAGKDVELWLQAEAAAQTQAQANKSGRAQPLQKTPKPRRSIG
jgi:hypothetical protein